MSWSDIVVMVVMYVLTVLGITVGFHRLFAHRAFEAGPVVQGVFAVLGSMAVQGPLIKWVALHRCHHRHSDTADDPHSPHRAQAGLVSALRGAWYSHIGWFFTPDPAGLDRYVKDLRRNKIARVVSDLFPLWTGLSLLLPAGIGGILTHTWTGAACGLLWGGLVRIFLVHHVTWSVNSLCHIWGTQPYDSGDHSRNNVLMGFLALGEGWHNNHHAFPFSARHGLRWWQFDLSYLTIRVLETCRLARNVRLPAHLAGPSS